MLGVALAAGEGKRMRPLSKERPKPLIPTLDVPQLCWTLARLSQVQPSTVWVNSHYFPEQIETVVSEVADVMTIQIRTSFEEEEALGTAGALKKLQEELNETFVVTSSDIATDFPIQRLIDAHESSGASATLLAIPSEDSADFLIEEGWVGDLVDRQTTVRAGHMFGNVAVFEPDVLSLISEGPSGMYESIFTALMNADRGIATVEWDGYWFSVTSPQDHLNINLEALSGVLTSDLVRPFNAKALTHEALVHVGEGATVDDVEMRHTVVGRGSTVAPGTVLERCVVWSGSQVRKGVYRDAVITPSQVVAAR